MCRRDAIFGDRLAAGVHQLLQPRFRVLFDLAGIEVLEEGAEGLHHRAPRGRIAAVEEDGAEHGFERVCEHRVFDRVGAQPCGEAEPLRHFDERLRAHEHRAQLGQLAFGKLGEALVELVRDGAAKDAVAQEFQPLVVVRPVAAVRERPFEQARVAEAVAEELYRPPLESAM